MNTTDFKDQIVVVTGGSNGIGKALAEEAKREGAKHIVIADVADDAGRAVAESLGGSFYHLDASNESDTADMISDIEVNIGPIGVYFSNAGVLFTDGPTFTCYGQSADQWNMVWGINVMSHLHAARALLPRYTERGAGCFVLTASAAGLLSQIGDALYSTTKHATIGYAEAMAIAHGDEGVQVSVICPQAVESNMTADMDARTSTAAADGIMPSDEMAKRAIAEIKEGHFMVRPHEQVISYFQHKAENYDRWVGAMRKFRRSQIEANGKPL